MAATIFMILSIAAECFLLYALVRFASDARSRQRRYLEDCGNEPPRLDIAYLQFVGPTSIKLGSIGTFDRSLLNGVDTQRVDIKFEDKLKQSAPSVRGHVCSPRYLPNSSTPLGIRSLVVTTSAPVADVMSNLTSQVKMRVVVIATTPKGTVAALRTVARLAADLGAQITLISIESVPWECSLQEPPVPVPCLKRKLYGLIYEAGILKEEVLIQLCLCRYPSESLRAILRPNSLVVLGARNHWWSRRERGLKKFLMSIGHEVFLPEHGPNVPR
jgi:hypothetical protein